MLPYAAATSYAAYAMPADAADAITLLRYCRLRRYFRRYAMLPAAVARYFILIRRYYFHISPGRR